MFKDSVDTELLRVWSWFIKLNLLKDILLEQSKLNTKQSKLACLNQSLGIERYKY